MSEQSKAPDYQPYLVDGDLRTPEDVRAFVASFGTSAFTGDVLRALDERLDRERRQACRRAVRLCVKEILRQKQFLRVEFKRGHFRENTFGEVMTRKREQGWIYYLRLALAFRKEARKP
jgi:hypothetical protein